ncbi:MAG TPA: hypothetical protein VLE91_02730 [Candidatus Saccharimonadales bacterium]|nr:hypothetical protein [Candidatus Saccharimonadales bacterium]
MNPSETLSPEQQFQHFMGQARTLPKVDPADPRVAVYRAAQDRGNVWYEGVPFGGTYKNNFYRLFTFYKEVDIDHPADTITAMSLSIMLKPIREKWQTFLDQNPELLEQTDAALKRMFEAEELERYIDGLKHSNDKSGQKKFREINQVVDHPIGAHAYWAAAREEINPLLEKADKAMQVLGIDTTPFYSMK